MKTYNTIGCCGIDCGLCPRFHTNGPSACPGCGGEHFSEKHPSCGFLTCCVTRHRLEVCAFCEEYPCKRFEPEKSGYDSFVTHQRVFPNLDRIRDGGITPFLEQQTLRMEILLELLRSADDGRSKSYFCLSCALMPVEQLEELRDRLRQQPAGLDVKVLNGRVREYLSGIAEREGIVLKLRSKG